MPVRRVHVERAQTDHKEYDGELEDDDGGVDAGAFLNALHQNDGDEQGDDNRGQIEPSARQGELSGFGDIVERRIGEDVGQMEMEEREEILKVVGPAVGHGGRGHRILENQVPADDPGKELAQRGVGVGVGRAGHRHHGGELGITQGGEDTGDPGNDERQHKGRAGAIVCCDASQNENAGADDRSYAEAGELHGTQNTTQALFSLKFFQQNAMRLPHEQLVGHVYL